MGEAAMMVTWSQEDLYWVMGEAGMMVTCSKGDLYWVMGLSCHDGHMVPRRSLLGHG